MNPWLIGANRNWPKDDAAVAMPKIRLRFSAGTLRPKAAMTIENLAGRKADAADDAGREIEQRASRRIGGEQPGPSA